MQSRHFRKLTASIPVRFHQSSDIYFSKDCVPRIAWHDRDECFTDTEGLICQALLLGNTEAAVELCLQNGRMADAIILAMTGGSDLLAKTQYHYFQVTQFTLSH
jgi:hypothetical protein